LPDKSGFTISGTDHKFLFEEDGGWYDEFENYYDAEGNYVNDDDEGYGEDKNLQKFAIGYDVYGEEDDEDDKHNDYENLYANTENNKQLSLYLDDTNIDIEIKNINYRADKKQLIDFLKSKAKCDKFDF